MRDRYEIAHIKIEYRTTLPWMGDRRGDRRCVAVVGGRVIAATDWYRRREHYYGADEQEQQLVASLAADGWEPAGINNSGRVTVMKRLISPTGAADDPTQLLQQLSSLHKAGVLTDEEFATKKAEILKRM